MHVPVRLFIFVTVLTLIPSTADAAVAGTACKKLGSIKTVAGIKYACTKSKGKLLWVSTKPVTASPTPSSTPTPTPTPTRVLTASERWDATGSKALEIYRKHAFNARGMAATTPVKYDFAPNFWPEVEKELRVRMDSAVAFWDRIHKPSIPIYFTAGTHNDGVWACTELNRQDSTRRINECVDNNKPNQNEENVARAWYLNNGLSAWYLLKSPATLEDRGFFPRVEHEYVHAIQYDLAGMKWGRNTSCWFIEGGAEYLGILTASHGNEQVFLRNRSSSITAQGPTVRNMSASDLATWISSLGVTRWRDSDNIDHCMPFAQEGMYHHALLATEWVVDRLGMDGYIAFVRKMRTTSWAQLFTETFGKSEAELYVEIGNYMEREIKIAFDNDWIRRS